MSVGELKKEEESNGMANKYYSFQDVCRQSGPVWLGHFI
jgi:hypothetical protein